MARVRHGFRSLGLGLLAVLGLMGCVTVAAQATWDEAGVEITKDVLIDGKLKETMKLLLPGLNIEIRCTSMDVEADSRLRALPNIDALLFILFLGCTTHLISTGAEQPACKPTFLLARAKVVPFLHNGSVKLLALPETGQTRFAQLDFPGTCSFFETNTFTGSIVFECEDGALKLRSCSVPAVNQFIRPVSHAIQLSLYPTDALKFGSQTMMLDGESEISLVGEAAKKSFNALI